MTIRTFHHHFSTSRFAVLGEENASVGTLVLLHGLYENLHIWDNIVTALSSSYRIVVMDLLGHNPDTPLSQQTIFTIGDMAETVMALLTHCSIDKVVIAGHSMGGAVAMQCLKHYSERMQGLCLFHATPFADPPEVRISRQSTIDSIAHGGKEAAITALLQRVLPESTPIERPEMVAKLHTLLREVPESGMVGAQRAMRDREDTSAILENIPIPVLFLLGKQDTIIPIDAMLPLVIKPRTSLLYLLDGVGHTGMLEAPKECMAALRSLMDISA